MARTQARYLALLLFASAYAAGVHLSSEAMVEVQVLGLRIPRTVVEAAAVSLLGIVALAFFGTGEALYTTLNKLSERAGVDADKVNYDLLDQHPTLLDFLFYSTFHKGRTTYATILLWPFLYPLPLVAVLLFAASLWWGGWRACPYPPWLTTVQYVNGAILLWAFVRMVVFTWQHGVSTVASVKDWQERRKKYK